MTPKEYIASAAEPKRSELAQLDALIRRTVPSFAPYMAGSMIGYGEYRYRYESGREGVSCRVGLAANKTGISVYVAAADERGYLAEQVRDELGKASVGRSCIRFKRLADIDLDALAALLKRARKLPGPGEVRAPKTTARAGEAPPRQQAKGRPKTTPDGEPATTGSAGRKAPRKASRATTR